MTNTPSNHGTSPPDPARAALSSDLAGRLGDLARFLQDLDDVGETLQGIVETAVHTIPGAAHAGVSVFAGRTGTRTMRTPAASDELVNQVDHAQIEFEQGPCLDALYDKRTVSLPDTSAEPRWPRFAARAAELGVASMLSFQLYVLGENLGALNLYAPRPHAFDAESERVGALFAAHAAVAMAAALEVSQLEHAVDTRDLIGQAKGILMERHKLTAEQAFALLIRTSQHTNTKIVDVADYLTHRGELPPTPH
ncbi:GAF and ANTAR domain-containing protein [Nocardia takedensis]